MLAGVYSIIRDVLNHVDVLQRPELRDHYVDILTRLAKAMRVLGFNKDILISTINGVYELSNEIIEKEVESSYKSAVEFKEAISRVKPPETRIEGVSEKDKVKELLIEVGVANEYNNETAAFLTLIGAINILLKDTEFFNKLDLIRAYALKSIISIEKTRRKLDEETLIALQKRVCAAMNIAPSELDELLKEIDVIIRRKYKTSGQSIFM